MISCLRACNWNIPHIATPLLHDPVLLTQNNSLSRAVTKISSCQANTTSRQGGGGIKQLGISFGCILFPFSYERSLGWIYSWKPEENCQPPALNDSSAKASKYNHSLRKQPTFYDTTCGFPAKWHLRNECRNFILMTRVVLLIGLAAWEICFSLSEALPRSGSWCVISKGILGLFLRHHYAGKPVVAFFSLIQSLIKIWIQDLGWSNFPEVALDYLTL